MNCDNHADKTIDFFKGIQMLRQTFNDLEKDLFKYIPQLDAKIVTLNNFLTTAQRTANTYIQEIEKCKTLLRATEASFHNFQTRFITPANIQHGITIKCKAKANNTLQFLKTAKTMTGFEFVNNYIEVKQKCESVVNQIKKSTLERVELPDFIVKVKTSLPDCMVVYHEKERGPVSEGRGNLSALEQLRNILVLDVV